MQARNVFIIAKREFLSRIRSKSFWLATVALPLFMVAMIVVPSLVMSKTKAEEKLVLVDGTGKIGPLLVANLEHISAQTMEQASFDVELVDVADDPETQRTELDQRVLDDEISSWVWISPEGLADDQVEYHAESVSNFITQQVLRGGVTAAVSAMRLSDAGFDVQAIGELSRPISLDTIRVSAEGSRAEGGGGAFVLAIGLFFMLYMVILLYGSQVMLGVLEEKSSRVVEVMLSAVRPVELMTGKLAGICLVGMAQLAVWLGTAAILLSPGVIALSFLPEGLDLPTLEPALVAHFFGFFLLGFFLYASFYAMVGAAFNDQQEAQQMSMIGVVFVVAPMMVLMPVLNDPNSALAVTMSLIPFFTPLIMMLRIAVEMPPMWQIALSYVFTIATCAGMIWLAARVYRVGILMYGKKPSPQEIWRWIRHG